jgi:hypothetical protein
MEISELGAQFHEAKSNGDFSMLDPFGAPTDLVLAIAGPYSLAKREARYKYQDALNEATNRGRKPIKAKDAEKFEDEFLADLVVGWHGLEDNGKPVIRTDEEAVALLRRAPWIREQVLKVVSDDKAFLRRLRSKTPIDAAAKVRNAS